MMRYVIGLLVAILLTSCEGFRNVLLFNKTRQTITVETKPELYTSKFMSATDSIQARLPSKVYKVLPDSILVLLAGFGPAAIRPNSLIINYLKITTPNDTIVADGKVAILRLVKDRRTKFRRRTDKAYYIGNTSSRKAIFVRQ